MTKEEAKNTAYGLMLIIGTIQDEMNKGGEGPTMEEVDNMYDLAVELNEYFEE
jgi:hypothetical protein